MNKEEPAAYFGIIEIGQITNNGLSENFLPMEENHVRFVHYADCQQLIIWLPQAGREYGMFRLINNKTKKIIEEWPVPDHLNGSIQLLRDTLPLAPGSYCIGIEWKEGCYHSISFKKLKAGVVKKVKKPVAEKKKEENILHSSFRQYRDGSGNVIEDEDLKLRERLKKQLVDKFSRRIEFDGTYRAGSVLYKEGETQITFWHEMGGGNCMFFIDVPPEAGWEAQTKTPLSSRKEIIEFVAREVQRRQAPATRYVITDTTITYYHK